MSEINILFLGDIVGRPGRRAVIDLIGKINTELDTLKNQGLIDVVPDFVIANVENASHGFGLTRKNHLELCELGIDAMTSGNHIWDKKEVFEYIKDSQKLIRPLNYPDSVPGVGYRIIEKNGIKLAVINLLGKVFMPDIDSPWNELEKIMEEIKKETDLIFVDFHAEATAEKMAFGYFCDSLGVSAFCGTHTHVQTADERILVNGCAYVTDAGFCGASDAVIGMEFDNSYKRLRTYLPDRFDVADTGVAEANGVLVTIDTETAKSVAIKRIKHVVDFNKENKKMEG
ncbi:MAG: TIGR00282 family metallophosphoesterase [Candidatus Gastranaerophilales bacterium]|nr:TIGR00282 family metallophosphoesterase [Candidatus Gastranaerophilales bacterium]